MGKTVLPSKFQEWKGLDRISLAVHEMGCIFREITKDDYGLDGEIEIVVPKADGKGYETTGGILKVQAKSGRRYVVSDSEEGFSFPIEKVDLEAWFNSNVPVVLIVYHPDDDQLYWKDIRSYVRNTTNVFQSPLRISFNKTNDRFDTGCLSRVSEAAGVTPRVSRQQRERLYSNLLLVKRLPKLITCSPTEYKDHQHVKSELKGASSPFTVFDGNLYTLDDLRNPKCRLREFCDPKQINDASAEHWAQDGTRRRDLVFLINQLFGSHLYHCGLKYNKHFKREYFPRQNDADLVFRQDWYNVRTGRAAPARSVVKFYEYGHTRFWRHTAASFNFKRIGSSWFLQIVPRYLFTTDGETPCEPELVGPYTTGIKAKEHNYAVLNHVLFWADVLSQRRPVIELKLHHARTLMTIEKEPFSGIANFAIPNDPATYEEEIAQTDLLAGLNVPLEAENGEEGTGGSGIGESDEY